MKIKATVSSLMFALVFFGTQAEAHTFGAQGAGFTAGATHPFLGIDHLLAMVAIGIWAVQLGGAAVWRVPLTFIGVLAASACLAAYGPQPAQLEI
ncbi:MAG: HupE/UreJ family protein, partial [Gammaproteobacteria bacterium]